MNTFALQNHLLWDQFRNLVLASALAAGLTATSAGAAEAPDPKLALSFKPVQSDVDYEVPAEKEIPQCKVQVEKLEKGSGWVVFGPAGQPLRRFVDTNGDNVVDQWRYYQRGIETYRDVDSNFNSKVDQSRWLNTSGSRWGIDTNEDGKFERWKTISAEEASREAIRAMVARDERILSLVLVTADDLRELGLTGELAEKIKKNVANPGEQIRKITAKSTSLTAKSQWMRFDSAHPSLIPADQVKSKVDLLTYDHAMAIVETGSNSGLVQLGEMIRVGETWKLTRIPEPLEGTDIELAASLFQQPTLGAETTTDTTPATTTSAVSEKVQKLIDDLRKLDEKIPDPNASKAVVSRYYRDRQDLLQKLYDASETDEERDTWGRQIADGLSMAVQIDAFPEGLVRLEKFQADLKKTAPKSPLVAYTTYRVLLCKYNSALKDADADEREKVQKNWVASLETFVQENPKADDTPEALWQLGTIEEFNGKLPEARKWYERLRAEAGENEATRRGAGAIKRLDLVGQPLQFEWEGLNGGKVSSAALPGKVVLVVYWASWCKPFTEDLPQIKTLYEQYHSSGFEVIGVNLDSEREAAAPYIAEHKIPWPQVYEPGGLESPPAAAFGIVSLPTMFLTDSSGKVINRAASVADLKAALSEMLKK